MTKGSRIFLGVAGLMLAASVTTLSGCWQAYHEQHEVSLGMSVTDVFNAVDHWDLCLSTYRNPATNEFGMFNVLKEPGGHLYRLPKYDKTFPSKEEFLPFVAQQMSNGQA
jgi:hypothetical protein